MKLYDGIRTVIRISGSESSLNQAISAATLIIGLRISMSSSMAEIVRSVGKKAPFRRITISWGYIMATQVFVLMYPDHLGLPCTRCCN